MYYCGTDSLPASPEQINCLYSLYGVFRVHRPFNCASLLDYMICSCMSCAGSSLPAFQPYMYRIHHAACNFLLFSCDATNRLTYCRIVWGYLHFSSYTFSPDFTGEPHWLGQGEKCTGLVCLIGPDVGPSFWTAYGHVVAGLDSVEIGIDRPQHGIVIRLQSM
jgi:hypothetical protein